MEACDKGRKGAIDRGEGVSGCEIGVRSSLLIVLSVWWSGWGDWVREGRDLALKGSSESNTSGWETAGKGNSLCSDEVIRGRGVKGRLKELDLIGEKKWFLEREHADLEGGSR